MILVGFFAIFHGHAHGAEMRGYVSGFCYCVGFVRVTAVLDAIGIGLRASCLQSSDCPNRREYNGGHRRSRSNFVMKRMFEAAALTSFSNSPQVSVGERHDILDQNQWK